MDHTESYFLAHNKLLEEKLDYCIHGIEKRLDKLYERRIGYNPHERQTHKTSSSSSCNSYLHFKAPYIRDFRNFSGPSNNDLRQIRDLRGTENIDTLIKNKSWSKESKQQLVDTVLEHYSKLHIVELIKQRSILTKQLKEAPTQNQNDIKQKLALIEEQSEQVKARKDQRIFVPEDRAGPGVDWCAISAKLCQTHHDAQDCRLLWSNQLHWSISDGPWTREEDACLLDAVQKYGKNDWDSVAKELNSNRLPWQCCARYHQEFTNSCCGPTPMQEDDIDKIVEVINLCRIGNFVPWNQVMYFIKYHSLHQVKYQWHRLLSERRSNQPWSHAEDVLLLKTVERFGDRVWARIANYIPGRSNKSCRERYTMRLKFTKRALGNWKSKEDEKLLSLVEQYGTNWSLISRHFSERNSHQFRNRYELLKNEVGKTGPIKRRRLFRNADGFLINLNGRRHKPDSDREVDEKLAEIFSTYGNFKSHSKSLVCRSAQDDLIYQTLVKIIRNSMVGEDTVCLNNLLGCIIEKALRERVSSKYDLYTPCVTTLRGFKAWSLQQDYLTQFADESEDNLSAVTDTTEYHQLLKIVMSLFLWPAILSKIKRPEVRVADFQVGSIIEKDTKNLYKIREIQKQVVSSDR